MSKIQATTPPCEGSASSSFEERSAKIQLGSLLLIFAGYLAVAARMAAQGITALPPYVVVFALATVLLVFVLIVGYAVAALASRPEARDERDRVISWRAESHSGWVVATGVIGGIAGLCFSLPSLWIAHWLLLSLFFAEVLKLVLQIIYYRRGW